MTGGMLAKVMCVAIAGGVFLLAFSTKEERGRDLFVRRCSGCHALDVNRGGPLLRDVYGRQAAGVRGFPYSDAIRKLEFRWDEAGLNRWLSDPESMAPGTDMAFRVTDADERDALIAYLKSLDSKALPSR